MELISWLGYLLGLPIIWLMLRLRTRESQLAKLGAAQNQLQATNQTLTLAIQKKELENALLDQKNILLQDNLDSIRHEKSQAEKTLKEQFGYLSHAALKEQSESFQKQQSNQMNNILAPLRDQLSQFKERLEVTYDSSLRDHSTLGAQIKQLTELNGQLSNDAQRLSQALTGNVKTQGLWGEQILERVLEAGGLREGHEYIREGKGLNLWDDSGKLQKPDVVLLLPDEKHLIIDAKVSLVAYERSVNAETAAESEEALKEHVRSVERHVSGLAKRYYQNNAKLLTPDLVLLFIPIEGALSAACLASPELLSRAWGQRVIVASPTTLLASALTISSVWKYASQTKNAEEIARQGAKLYDKICLFAEQLEKVGKHLETASEHYTTAWNRLSHGRDNVLRNAEKLRELGITSKKRIQSNPT